MTEGYKNPPTIGIWVRSGKDGLWYNATNNIVKDHCGVCIDGTFYWQEHCCF